MTVSTLRPNSTVANTTTVLGSDADAVLADDNDSTGLLFVAAGELWRGDLTDLTLPAGAVVKRLAVRLRTNINGPAIAWIVGIRLTIGAETIEAQRSINWASATTTTLWVVNQALFADADIDAASLEIKAIDGSFVVWEAYVDVTYVERPVITSITVNGGVNPVEEDDTPTISWTWS